MPPPPRLRKAAAAKARTRRVQPQALKPRPKPKPPVTRPRKLRKPTPPRPAEAGPRGSALVSVGDGLGNVIEQSALIPAVIALGYSPVDVTLPKSNALYADALRGYPGIREIYVNRSRAEPRYAALFTTFSMGRRVGGSSFGKVFCGPHPRSSKQREAEAAVEAARQAGFRGETPGPICMHDPFPWESWPQLAGQRLVAIGTGSNVKPPWRKKRYPPHLYAWACQLLQDRDPELRFVLVGSPADDLVTGPLTHGILDLRGKLPLRQAFGLLKACRAFLGNDSGLSHAAAALGTPTFVAFGPTVVSKNLPLRNAVAVHLDLPCRPCQYSRRGMGKYPKTGKPCHLECLQELPPERLANAAWEALKP